MTVVDALTLPFDQLQGFPGQITAVGGLSLLPVVGVFMIVLRGTVAMRLLPKDSQLCLCDLQHRWHWNLAGAYIVEFATWDTLLVHLDIVLVGRDALSADESTGVCSCTVVTPLPMATDASATQLRMCSR